MKLQTPACPRNKNTIKTVDCEGETGSRCIRTGFFSAGKVMATVFCDSHWVILIDYLQKEKVIKGAYYESLLVKLKTETAENSHICRKKLVSPRQCAVSHFCGCMNYGKKKSMKSMNSGWNCLTTLLTHHIYSPSYLFLLPKLKVALEGQRFSTNEEAITFVNKYFAEKNI